MAPESALPTQHGSQPGVTTPTAQPAWMIQASRRHCHFGLKPASRGFAAGTPADDFRPGKVGVK